jgi:hypothetical protein
MDTRRTQTVTRLGAAGPSLLQMSAAQRLGLALIACAVVWAAIGLALV